MWGGGGEEVDVKQAYTALYTRAHQMVHKPLANGSQTKCTYMWMGLLTCAAPSAKGSHTVRRKPKFVGFLCEHKENWMRRCPFHTLGVIRSPQVRGKLINHAPLTRRTRTVQSACIYKTEGAKEAIQASTVWSGEVKRMSFCLKSDKLSGPHTTLSDLESTF